MDSDGYDSDKVQPGDKDFDPFAPRLFCENTKQCIQIQLVFC